MPLKKPLNLDASVPKIDALVLMDTEGKRIAVDYFTAGLYVVVVCVFGSHCNSLTTRPSHTHHPHPHPQDVKRPGAVRAGNHAVQ